MANYQAIRATCEGVIELLRRSWRAELFGDAPLDFAVYRGDDFATPMTIGVSLFLYHVSINQVSRTMPGRFDPVTGRRRYPELPLDLHFILTPWANSASMTLQILGWMMRILEDNPSLNAMLLNREETPVFEDDETVDIVAGQMTYEEIFRIWEVLPGDFRLSVPYISRVVRVESQREEGGDVVLQRHLNYVRRTDS